MAYSSGFKFSTRSQRHLEGVKPELVDVCHLALELSKVDFGIIDGLRTLAEQEALFNSGASQTMASKHFSGDAVDVMAYVGARGSWELPLYEQIASAFRVSAIKLGTPVRWGGAWHLDDIRLAPVDMAEAVEEYVELRRSQGRKPFVDAGHFELM